MVKSAHERGTHDSSVTALFARSWGVLPALVAGALIIMVLAGCGGSRSAAARTTAATPVAVPSSPRTRFIASAEAICKRLNSGIAAGNSNAPGMAEIRRDVPKNLALERTALVELEHLSPPPAMTSAWRRMNHYRQSLIDSLAKLQTAAERNELSALSAIASRKIREHKLLRDLGARGGFRYCALV